MDPRTPSPATPTPTLTPADLEARQQLLDERDARLLTVLTVLGAVAAAFCLALAFQVLRHTLGRHAAAAPSTAVEACREGEVPSRCADGQICQAGVCVAESSPR